MKLHTYTTLLSILLISYSVKGQSTYVDNFSLKISSIDFNRSISGEIESGDIEVIGIDGDSINIVAEVYNASGKNYTCKQDECMIVDNNFFHFSVRPRLGEKIKKVVVLAPKDMSISIKILGKGSVTIDKMHSEIQVITNRVGNITVNDAKGPLSICGTYGDIKIDFAKGISKKTMAICLVKGNIQIGIHKGEAVSFVSLCSDEKSTMKDYPINQISSFKSINGTLITNNDKGLNGNRNMTINAKFQERIENRKFLKKGANNAKRTIDRKTFKTKEDVYVYDINGGGTNIELNIYDGLIRIDEKN